MTLQKDYNLRYEVKMELNKLYEKKGQIVTQQEILANQLAQINGLLQQELNKPQQNISEKESTKVKVK